MIDERPNPDELLDRVKAEEAKAARGKLKIFFGMAPGVGKTFAMLEAARKAAKEGADVVVGYIEPHARPETQALVMGLDILARKTIEYRGKTLYEFDRDAALARKPQICLVDELAHTNAEGMTHPKRWQDIEDLLAAGIDVYTTLNVQHLDSLSDIVSHVTSIPVRETLPDQVFERADEVELVDLPPDDLLGRLREGKVYVSQQASRAIENFFRKGNLIALRELALRKMADRVNAQALDYRQTHDVEKVWQTSDRLLVCVGPSPMSARLVRAARRMAATLRAPWIALHIELDRAAPLALEDRRRLESNLRLATELGATVDSTSGERIAPAVIEYSQKHNITKIIVGKPRPARWSWSRRDTLVNELIRESGDIDVYVISGEEESAAHVQAKPAGEKRALANYVWAIAWVALCTLFSWLLFPYVHATNLVMLYLAAVVIVSIFHGRGPSILATVLGVIAFDLFFVPPYGTFVVSDTQYLFTFGVMLITGLVISELTSRVRRQSEAIRDRESRTAALYALSRSLANLPTKTEITATTRRILRDNLDVEAWVAVIEDGGELDLATFLNAHPQGHNDAGVFRWVAEHRRPAGLGTDTLPGSHWTCLPLTASGEILGVIGLQPPRGEKSWTTTQRELVSAAADLTASALERCQLSLEAEKARFQVETERLRNSLLSSVSHDLRTPLASITGAASLLVEQGAAVNDAAKRELAESILDESDRLNRLVVNLLDLTRLEAGAIQLKKELQPIEEVIGVVLERMERQLRDHPVAVDIPADLPPIFIDSLLIQQVLINLLDNAVKFSPKGSGIELHCRQVAGALVLELSDLGHGIPAGEEQRIFEKFHRASTHVQSGSGIGLAICRGIVKLHGGELTAENRPGGGATIRLTLPLTSPQSDHRASPLTVHPAPA
jgi:two-component system sensor histidine kinase KdpD